VPARAPGAQAAPRLDAAGRARLVAEILATYAVVRWRLRRSDLPAILAALRAGRRRGTRSLPFAHDERRLAAATVRVLRVLPSDARCLTRSLVVVAMLARRGIATRLVIAVRPDPAFAAHAWVEHGGRPLLPTEGFGDLRLVEL
jgi:transglutaminase superfamily protein